MNRIEIRTVVSKKDTEEFVRLPWAIYKDYPQWVPPLLMDRRKLIDREKNPFYKHSEAEFFLAYRDGHVAGRIGAILNHNHNREHKENIGFFGFFECVNDQSVADALFKAAREKLKKYGVTAVRGPANPSVNDEYGLLVDGFDLPPVVLMTYNPPYYAELIERAGFRKVKDLYSYGLSQETVMSERLERISRMVKEREGLTFRTLNMDDFKGEVDRIKSLYNRAWMYNWGAVPMTDEEFDCLAKDLKPVIVPELVIIAEYKEEPIGFALSLPDLNVALKHNKRGWLIPGFFCLMRYRKKIHSVRIVVLGVVRERLNTGAANVLFYETAKRGMKLGYYTGEAGWVLEDNVRMIRAAEFMNGKRYKTYRIYESTI